MSQVYDYHCHSDQSDGALSPELLVQRAKQMGVDSLALTDHDTIAGVSRAAAEALKQGIELISGIEISSQWQGRGIHIVGLNIDIDAPVIVAAAQSQAEVRRQRAQTIAERLAKVGVSDALAGASRFAGNAEIGRPHFARFLVESGSVSNFNQAFKRYLGAGRLGDVKNNWPQLQQAVGWILDAGGIPVLAHPAKYKMTRTKLCVLTQAFKEAGGLAIEVVSGKQPVGLAENLARIALQYQLAVSCGSDFHVPDQPWQELGCGGVLNLSSELKPVWALMIDKKSAASAV